MSFISHWFPPRVRRTLAQLALVAAAIALLWWTLRVLGGDDVRGLWAEAWGLLRRLSWGAVAALLVLNALVLWTLMLRWWLFLRAQGVQISMLRLLSYRLAGFALSYFTPGPQIGGEPLQIYLLARQHAPHKRVPLAAATVSITLDKLLEFSTNFGLLLLGALFVFQQQRAGRFGDSLSTGGANWQVALYVLLCTALLWTLWRLLRGRLVLTPLLARIPTRTSTRSTRWRTTIKRAVDAIERVERQAIALAREQPRTVAWAVVVSLASWGLMIAEFWLSTRVLGFQLSLAEAVLALVAMRAAYLLPFPAAVGSLEAALIWALASFGLPPAAGIGLSLLIRVRDVLIGAVGLLITITQVGSLRAAANFSSAPPSGRIGTAKKESPVSPPS